MKAGEGLSEGGRDPCEESGRRRRNDAGDEIVEDGIERIAAVASDDDGVELDLDPPANAFLSTGDAVGSRLGGLALVGVRHLVLPPPPAKQRCE